jgi:hypothetical protein
LDAAGWSWETDANASKLLGFPVAQSISKAQMTTMLMSKLEENLEKSRRNPASLMACITIANHFVSASL